MTTGAFKAYVLGGRFSLLASAAVADAIAQTRARGLPIEGYANTAAPIPSIPPVSAQRTHALAATEKKTLRRAA